MPCIELRERRTEANALQRAPHSIKSLHSAPHCITPHRIALQRTALHLCTASPRRDALLCTAHSHRYRIASRRTALRPLLRTTRHTIEPLHSAPHCITPHRIAPHHFNRIALHHSAPHRSPPQSDVSLRTLRNAAPPHDSAQIRTAPPHRGATHCSAPHIHTVQVPLPLRIAVHRIATLRTASPHRDAPHCYRAPLCISLCTAPHSRTSASVPLSALNCTAPYHTSAPHLLTATAPNCFAAPQRIASHRRSY
jgi:hypothetical protein